MESTVGAQESLPSAPVTLAVGSRMKRQRREAEDSGAEGSKQPQESEAGGDEGCDSRTAKRVLRGDHPSPAGSFTPAVARGEDSPQSCPMVTAVASCQTTSAASPPAATPQSISGFATATSSSDATRHPIPSSNEALSSFPTTTASPSNQPLPSSSTAASDNKLTTPKIAPVNTSPVDTPAAPTITAAVSQNAVSSEAVHHRGDEMAGSTQMSEILMAAAADAASRGMRGTLEPSAGSVMAAVKKCEVCGEHDRRYCCPRCGKLTCSLTCCLQHKKMDDCNGKRDKVGFVGLKEFTDSHVRSDFNFLEDALRCMDGGRRDLSSRPGMALKRGNHEQGGHRGKGRGRGGGARGRRRNNPPDDGQEASAVPGQENEGAALGMLSAQTDDWLKRRAPPLQRLVREAALRGTRLLLMPDGMARRQHNTTRIVKRNDNTRKKKNRRMRGGEPGNGRGQAADKTGRGGIRATPGRGCSGAIPRATLPKGMPSRGAQEESSSGALSVPAAGHEETVPRVEDARTVPGGGYPGSVSQEKDTANIRSVEGVSGGGGDGGLNGVLVVGGKAAGTPESLVGTDKPILLDEEPVSHTGDGSDAAGDAVSEATGEKGRVSQTRGDSQRPSSGNGDSRSLDICDANGTKIPSQDKENPPPPVPSSRTLLEIEEGDNRGGRASLMKLNSTAQPAAGPAVKSSTVVWRVEWVFSGVASSETREVEGLSVVDEGVSEETSLHEALARHLDPREGNAPLRHRLRKFSKPWATMVRAFALDRAGKTGILSSSSPSTREPAQYNNGNDDDNISTATSTRGLISAAGRSMTSRTDRACGAPSSATVTPALVQDCGVDGGILDGRSGSGAESGAIAATGSSNTSSPSLQLFLRRTPCPSKRPLYWEVYPADSLGAALREKTVIEYPTIYVSLPGAESARFHTVVTDLSRVPNAGTSKDELEVKYGKITGEKPGEGRSSSEDDSSSSSSEESSSESSEESSSESSEESNSDDSEGGRSGEKRGSEEGEVEQAELINSLSTRVL